MKKLLLFLLLFASPLHAQIVLTCSGGYLQCTIPGASFNSSTSALTLPGPLAGPSNVLSVKSGSSSQELRVFGDATQYISISHDGANSASITAHNNDSLNFAADGNSGIFLALNGATRWFVNDSSDSYSWLPQADNSSNIGSSARRVATVNTVNIANGTTGTVSFGGTVNVPNSFELKAGSSRYLSIAHDSTNGILTNGYGNLTITSPVDTLGSLTIGGATQWTQSMTTMTVTTQVVLSGLPTTTAALRDTLCTSVSNVVTRDTNAGGCLVSAAKFKENIEDMDMGLATVLALRPVTYNYRPNVERGSGRWMGFIADEALKVDERLGFRDPEGQPLGFNYLTYPAVLTKAIQELEARIKTLEAR